MVTRKRIPGSSSTSPRDVHTHLKHPQHVMKPSMTTCVAGNYYPTANSWPKGTGGKPVFAPLLEYCVYCFVHTVSLAFCFRCTYVAHSLFTRTYTCVLWLPPISFQSRCRKSDSALKTHSLVSHHATATKLEGLVGGSRCGGTGHVSGVRTHKQPPCLSSS